MATTSHVLDQVPRSPAPPPRAILTPEMRAVLERAAQAALDEADRLIAMLDRLDGDPDLDADNVIYLGDGALVGVSSDGEPDADGEPSLGWTEDGHASRFDGRFQGQDLEDDGDGEDGCDALRGGSGL